MWLYHATYRTNLKSIKDNGLGAKQIKNWEFSEDGVVCFCDDAEAAFTFCECSELASDYKIERGIIVLAVNSKDLSRSRVSRDPNINPSNGDPSKYFTYRGVIPANKLYVTTRDIDEGKGKLLGPLSLLKRVPGYE